MALVAVATGDPGVISNVNQYKDLLTGVMTDQQVLLNRLLTAGAALLFPQVTAAPPSSSGFGGGLRLALYGNPTNDQLAFGMGIDANTLWYVSAGGTHKWYGASGALLLTVSAGGLSTGGLSISGGAATFSSSSLGSASAGSMTVSGATTLDGSTSLPNVGTTWSNSGGAGFIIDRGSFSRAYSGGNDNSTYSTNVNFNGRTPTIVGSCTNQANGTACNFNMVISGNTINLLISSGDNRTYNFNWIAVG